MINRHEFQNLAKKFRGGRVSLSEFTNLVFPASHPKQVDSTDTGFVDLRLPVRPENSHKGDFGRLVFIGGSRQMPGAIYLSAMAGLKSGAGLVAIVTPDECQQTVASYSPCVMTDGLPSESGMFCRSGFDAILEKCLWADVVAIGPGMGRCKSNREVVTKLFTELERPMIVDADGLNNLADSSIQFSDHAHERILTPHPGEFVRLTKSKFSKRSEMEDFSVDFARRSKLTVVLKGHHSIVSDGNRYYRNETGNSGMATAGSGDVLTGIIASLVGQKMEVFDAAAIGCYLHGYACDLYSEKQNSASLIATDLINCLPRAITGLSNQKV